MDDLAEYPFELFTTVKKHDSGRIAYTVAYIPKKLQKQLPLDEFPRLRIDGEVCGHRFNNALHPNGGRWYVMLPKKLLKKCGLELGSDVLVQFRIADQNAVDVPSELERALAANTSAKQAWDKLTAGKKRGYAYRVSSAKRMETREVRVSEVLDWVVDGAPKKRRSRFGF